MDPIVRLRRRERHVFDASTGSGARLTVAAHGDIGAAGAGPMELMLVSLASCAASTLVDVLERMRRAPGDLRVLVEGDRRERPPRTWERIRLTYLVRIDLDEDRLRHAVAVAERICSAHAMLSRAAGLDHQVLQVRPSPAEPTRRLRQQVLRPHQTLDQLMVPGEEGPATRWFAAVRSGEVVGTAGILPDTDRSWRLRGMATDPSVRGIGLGEMLLDAALEHAEREGASLVWCSARIPARGFYERNGFRVVGDEYDVPEIGPHVRMERAL